MRVNQKLLSSEVISYTHRLIDILTFRVQIKVPGFVEEHLSHETFVVCLFCHSFLCEILPMLTWDCQLEKYRNLRRNKRCKLNVFSKSTS